MKNEIPNFPIDFVIPWVDGDDPIWQAKRRKFVPAQIDEQNPEENNDQRYRDFGTLRYLLRSIERFAPWVHKIFLLTDHQRPDWLDANQVEVVDHTEFIDKKYLPTFNSNVIEMNIPNIEKLSEHFVLLNDDLLFTQTTYPTDFFRSDGKILDNMGQSILMPRDDFSHIAINNIILINQNFSKRQWLSQNWRGALNFKNGFGITLLSVALSPLPYFTRFFDPHIGIAYTKTNFKDAKQIFETSVKRLMKNKVRGLTDISHWVVRYYQIVTGKVIPRSSKFGAYLTISESTHLNKLLSRPRHTKMIVLNDKVESSMDLMQANETMKILGKSFSKCSMYERGTDES